MSKEQKQTEVVQDNNNPLFYKTLELHTMVKNTNDKLTYPPFIIDVFDSDADEIGGSDDYLCRAVVPTESLLS